MKELEYPFDSSFLLQKRRKLKKALLADGSARMEKRIAVLGGSTTNDIVSMLELFLLNCGIQPVFYQSEYAQYWQDAMFDAPELAAFQPDLIFIHTTSRNITEAPLPLSASEQEVQDALERQYTHFTQMWEHLAATYHCPILQNNFELPATRLMGNRDGWDCHGMVWFISELNRKFGQYAAAHNDFYIHDIHYLAASYGLDAWHDNSYWYLYKYAMTLDAIPEFAYSLTRIIRSIYGKNKKVLALDLDNTLWGGVIGDDGQEGISIGQETAEAEAYTEVQEYCKAQKQLGVLLTICSKNEPENARLGLSHPDSVLHEDDFVAIKANWEPKDRNLVQTTFSAADANRSEMYRANAQRAQMQQTYANYTDYLLGLDMHADIRDFDAVALPRIVQLTNKSNQFNLTTRRYTQSEMEQVAADHKHIRLYGRLRDKFGDNGIVSVVIGEISGDTLHIELWLMSCRVLKRDMELAMLDTLVAACRKQGITAICGYYYKTAKNAMVKDLFGTFGFTKTEQFENGDSTWRMEIAGYENQNHVIQVNEKEHQQA